MIDWPAIEGKRFHADTPGGEMKHCVGSLVVADLVGLEHYNRMREFWKLTEVVFRIWGTRSPVACPAF